MKPILQYILASILAMVSALFTAAAIAATPVSVASDTDPAARIAQENAQANIALMDLATATLAKYGEADFPTAMAVQLSTLSALCRGVDIARINQRKNAPGHAAPRMQATNLRMLQVNHPLCKRLTATAI
jgi:hypothetical protein